MKGILMIEELYNATVAGRKTMTRRAGSALEQVNKSPDEYFKIATSINGGWIFSKGDCKAIEVLPRYKVGEVLFIKEPIVTRNDGTTTYYYDLQSKQRDGLLKYAKATKSNKLFMPASAARAYIRITGIKIERLHDISDADCIAEGIEHKVEGDTTYYNNYLTSNHNSILRADITPQESFFGLYKVANKAKEVPNLWVFCYEFEYLKNYKPNKP